MYVVYVLRSIRHDRLYIGVSENPARRLMEHNAGKTTSTRPFVPFRIIYSARYLDKGAALHREKQIKNSGKIRQELKAGTYTPSSSNGQDARFSSW
ncbi:GIY-YIG nuclease family protein [Candidatus Uhrbacteria bacterium]|nr:GIY-YIG nuclease family protein [Candidatus Uhrbacteria bacterium]